VKTVTNQTSTLSVGKEGICNGFLFVLVIGWHLHMFCVWNLELFVTAWFLFGRTINAVVASIG